MDRPGLPEAPEPVRARRSVRTRLIGLRDDHDAFDQAYFDALSPGEKMEMVSAMFADQWLQMGGNANELRLRRDVARIQRRHS